MKNYLELQKARKLTDLEIDEISLVDFPAIRKPFVIIKNDKPKQKWESVQRAFLGFSDDDLDLLPDSVVENVKIEKSTLGNPFPELAKNFEARHPEIVREILAGFESCFHDNR